MSLEGEEDFNSHDQKTLNSSKRGSIISLRVPTDLIVSGRQGERMTIISLHMSYDLRVSMIEIVGQPTKVRLLLLRILNEELRPT